MSNCIICDEAKESTSIEHILPEGFGNKFYVLAPGIICNDCNNRFSKFEDKALSSSIFALERARAGIATKKGKNVKGSVKELNFTGDEEFRKGIVKVEGLDENKNVSNFDPVKGTFKLTVQGFDKSEAATTKLLLKMGFESIFYSRKDVYNKYEFTKLKQYLKGETNKDWGFISAKQEIGKFNSVPKFNDKDRLNRLRCILRYQEKSTNELLFRFQYLGISFIINLLSRKLSWIEEYKAGEKHVWIYPNHFEERYKKGKLFLLL